MAKGTHEAGLARVQYCYLFGVDPPHLWGVRAHIKPYQPVFYVSAMRPS